MVVFQIYTILISTTEVETVPIDSATVDHKRVNIEVHTYNIKSETYKQHLESICLRHPSSVSTYNYDYIYNHVS